MYLKNLAHFKIAFNSDLWVVYKTCLKVFPFSKLLKCEKEFLENIIHEICF